MKPSGESARAPRPCRAWQALLLALTLSACDSGPTAEEHFDRAWGRYKEGDLRTAVIELKNALGKKPDYADARDLLGRTYLLMDNGELAEKELLRAKALGFGGSDFEEALLRAALLRGRFEEVELALATTTLQLDPTVQLVLRGTAKFGLQKYDEAHDAFQQALKIEPRLAGARRGLARIAMYRNDMDEAGRQVQLALEINPDDPQTLMDEGFLELQRGNYEAAAAAYEKILAKYPQSTIARVPLIRARLLQEKFGEADKEIADLVEAMGGEPPPEVLHLRAYSALRQGDLPEAERDLLDALGRNASYSPSLYLLGELLIRQGEYLKAAEYLRRYNAKEPRAIGGWLLLAVTQIRLQELPRALASAHKALAIAPDNPLALGMVGSIQMLLGDFDTAIELLDRAATLAPESGSLRTDLGRALITAGDIEGGLQQLRDAADDADFYPARHVLVMVQLRRGKYEEALAEALKITEMEAEDAIAWNLAGAAALGARDPERAYGYYEKALAVDPTFASPQLNLARMDSAAGDSAAARARYESLLARDDLRASLRADASVGLAKLDVAAGKPDDARRGYEAALTTDPGNAEALIGLTYDTDAVTEPQILAERLAQTRAADPGALAPRLMLTAYFLRGSAPAKALQAAEEAVNIAPQSEPALLLLAAALAANDRQEEAIAAARSAVENHPESARARIELARWAVYAGDNALGRSELDKALELEPANMDARIARAALAGEEGQMEEALAVARALQQELPNDVRGYNLEANLWLQHGDDARVLDALERAVEIAPTRAQTVSLFHARWRIGETTAAVDGLEQWLLEHPEDHHVRALAASVAQQQERYDAAVAHYRALLEALPEDIFVLNNLAWVTYLQGDIDKALAIAERAYGVAPEFPPVLDTYGWLQVQAGRYQQGLRLLESASQAVPEQADFRFHLAYAMWKVGQREGALKEVEQALQGELAGDDLEAAHKLQRLLRRE